MPIIPLLNLPSLQATLFSYQRQLLQPRDISVIANPAITILPFCTECAPLPQHTLNVLSDVFGNFKELAMAATTADGQEQIRKWLGVPSPQHAEGVIAFWLQEYVVD